MRNAKAFLAVQEESARTDRVLVCASAERQVLFAVGGVEKVTAAVAHELRRSGFRTHLFLIGGSPIPAAVLLVLSVTVAWNRWRR